MAYIYILHFNEPVAHANHYCGCTNNLLARMACHADGRGSRLTRELYSRGIEWTLAGLMTCTKAQMRRLERHLKTQHNTPRHCPLCMPNSAVSIPGTTPYPVSLMRLPGGVKPTSEGFRDAQILSLIDARGEWVDPVKGVMYLPTADLPASLQSEALGQIRVIGDADKDALGFIPSGGSEGLTILHNKKKLWVAWTERKVASYVATTTNAEALTIHQCATLDEARLKGFGGALVSAVIENTPNKIIQCNVREDLAANHFWASIGFRVTDTRRHVTSGSWLNHYVFDATQKE